jgi:hypothetical protein
MNLNTHRRLGVLTGTLLRLQVFFRDVMLCCCVSGSPYFKES